MKSVDTIRGELRAAVTAWRTAHGVTPKLIAMPQADFEACYPSSQVAYFMGCEVRGASVTEIVCSETPAV